MKHRFYSKTKKQRNQIQVLIGLAAILIIVFAFLISWATNFYLLVIIIFPIVLTLIAPFFDVPSLKKSGDLKYHSLLFLTEKPKGGLVKVHGGTLFDYVFVLDTDLKGKDRTAFIIQQYLQGLLNLIEDFEKNKTPNLIIRGTSYIINERTAQRIGFKVTESKITQKLILIFNIFNVLLTYSIAKGKLSIPKLSETKTFEANLSELFHYKETIINLNNKLKRALPSTTKY